MPRRRHRTRIPLLIALAGIAVSIAAYVLGMALLQSKIYTRFSFQDLIIPRLIDVVVVTWCAWIGTSIGSFLNVVAWRMPRGESINGRSKCPRCQSKLLARDNFPVFGWLVLGGRCRTCRLPISPRYPIVEAAVGTTITLIAIGQLYRFSLPYQPGGIPQGPLWSPELSAPSLITLTYHVIAVATAWAFGLIRMDGHRLPRRLIAFGLAATIFPMCLYPTLMVVPWEMSVDSDWRPDGRYLDALVRVLSALAASTIVARYLAKAFCPLADLKLDPLGNDTARLIDLIAILSIPSLIVGWQAFPAVVVVASLIASVIRPWLGDQVDALGRLAIAMPVALTGQLFFWRWLHAATYQSEDGPNFTYWPSDNGSPWVFLAWSAMVLLVPLWLHEDPSLRSRPLESPAPASELGSELGAPRESDEEPAI